MTDTIKVIKHDEVAEVRFNRPQQFNSFNLEMVEGFAKNLIPLASDESVRAVVITGEGKAFCAGGDLKWVLGFENGPAAAFHELAARFHQAVIEIRRMNKPVIAAVNGVAAGGGFSTALACDFRVMDEKAILRQAYTSNGLCIDGGGTFTLPRLVGMAKALEIAAFDEPIPADLALSWGLATKVAESGQALEQSLEMAHALAKRSNFSFGRTKQLINDSFDTSFETQIERERISLSECGAHKDGREGLTAFSEKRSPVFF